MKEKDLTLLSQSGESCEKKYDYIKVDQFGEDTDAKMYTIEISDQKELKFNSSTEVPVGNLSDIKNPNLA